MLKTIMIFAAGLGTRLQPLTNTKPKPCIEVAGKPLLIWNIELAIKLGFKRIIVNTHYMSDQVNELLIDFMSQKVNDIEIIITHEAELLETGGGLKNALEFCDEEFIVTLNSDAIMFFHEDYNPVSLLTTQISADTDIVMGLVDQHRAKGIYREADFASVKDGFIVNEAKAKKYIFTGMQIIRKSLIAAEKEQKFSLSKYYKFNSSSAENNIKAVIFNELDWLHVGCKKGLADAEHFIETNLIEYQNAKIDS